MIHNLLLAKNSEPIQELIPKFIVEDITEDTNVTDIQSLNGGIKKKFTSLVTNATIFRWKFGDETDPATYLETIENPIYHIYREKGIYNVSHQSCYPCIITGTLACSIEWCIKTIEVLPPKPPLYPWLFIGGFFGLLLISREKCETIETKEECIKEQCKWSDKDKRCYKPQKKRDQKKKRNQK